MFLSLRRPLVSHESALEHLRSEFPTVPGRIVASVLDAYRAVTPSVTDAMHAAHDRLRDACAH